MSTVLDRDAATAGGGRLTNRVGLFLIAMILGALVPVGVVMLVGSRDPAPPSCRSGKATAPATEGTIIYADQATLSLVEGDLNHSRSLVDYRPRPAPTPSPGQAAPSPSAPGQPQPRFLAATISSDHHTLAFMVADPPDAPGKLSLRVMDPLEPIANANEVWAGPNNATSGRTEITFLPQGRILFFVPQRFDPPETSARLVGVISGPPGSKVVQSGPEAQFQAQLHTNWPETRDYQLPPRDPRVDSRVIGPGDRVAGRVNRDFPTPLVSRTVHQVVTGKLGQPASTVVCGTVDDLTPVAFSPDGRTLALADATESYLLDPSGGHAAVLLLKGRLLDWRP